MKRITKKSIIEASRRMRNEQAILKLAKQDEKDFEYYGKPVEIKKEKSRNPFKIGSLWLSIAP